MRNAATRLSKCLILALGVLALALPAVAGIKDFKLAGAIPADATIVWQTRDHDGLAFIKEQHARVWKKIEEQHFEKDLRTFFKGLWQQNGGEIEEFEQQWQQFNDLLLGVEWGGLAEEEFAFAMKLSFPTPEIVTLFKSSPDKAASNYEGLVAILTNLRSFAGEGELVLSTQGEGDSLVHTLGVAESPFPLGLMLAREQGTIMIAFGQTLPEQTLALLHGEEGQALIKTERFQTAFKQLPAPTDNLFFIDTARFLGQVRAVMDGAISMADPTGEELEPEIKALPAKILEEVDIFDYIAAVATTDGMKTTADASAVFKDDAKNKALYKTLCGNGVLTEPLKFIPENAQNFSVWSGVNIRALYDGVIAFIGKSVPEGEQMLLEWEAAKADLKETAGINFEEDILGWIGGGLGTFTIPGKSAYSPSSSVFMLSVKDEDKARAMIDRLMLEIAPFLEQQSGMVRDAKIEGAEGFSVIVHPMLAMLGQPTLGVAHGQLLIGSNTAAVEAALNTAAGETPNFSTNKRFIAEGLKVESEVSMLEFTDLTKLGEELGQVFKMVPMIGMFVPELAQNPFGRAMLTAASKVGNVVEELNFFQSRCSQTTFDGQKMYTKTITNYREPPPPPTTEPTTEPQEDAATAEEPSDPDK
ncbi:MAG: hypothetical protein ABIG44_08520 [Planctomycetota bacterium]